MPLHIRRAIVALGFGAIGFFLAWSALGNAGTKYENFLLIIAYWIAPWLAVIFCDQFLRRRQNPVETERLLFDRKYANWAGPVAMAIGMASRRPDVRSRVRARRRDYLTWRIAANRGNTARLP